MTPNEILLIVLLIFFVVAGGVVDTYASYRFFPPRVKPPRWLSEYFLIWWLIVFVGLLPFLIAYTASGYSFWVIKIYITFLPILSVLWDLVFSKIWSGKWISDSCKTWFWVKKFNIGFDKKTIIRFHLVRLGIFLLMFYVFYILR